MSNLVLNMVTNTQYKTYNNKFEWRIDKDGLLRCTTNVLKSCVMPYTVSELGSDTVPEKFQNQRIVNLFVPDEEIENAESLASLEGKPISVDHMWQVGGKIDSVGNVAGTPVYNKSTGFLSADILVTDPDAIKRITNEGATDRLVDQSAAYRNRIEWVSGTSPAGEAYDGIQRDIEYNHIALLAQGAGRAGEEVRILNKDRSKNVQEFIKVKMGNSLIGILNEDVTKFENEMDKKDKEIENASDEDVKKVDDAKKEADESADKAKKLKSENEGLEAQVATLKDTISDLTSPSSMQLALNKALEEQADSTAICNSYVPGDSKEFEGTIKELHGHELRKAVVQQVRSQNKKPLLTDDELSSEANILGRFTALKETASMVSNKKTIAGAEFVKTMNAGEESAGKYDSAEKRKMLKFANVEAHFSQK